jgi:hypothetical protein
MCCAARAADRVRKADAAAALVRMRQAAEQRQQAMDAAVDTSDEGARRHRYLQDHQRTLRQLSSALNASKYSRLKFYGRILSCSTNEPAWTPPEPAAPVPQEPPETNRRMTQSLRTN